MKKKLLLAMMILLLSGLTVACSSRKTEASISEASVFDAMFLYSYFFDGDCILSSSSHYLKSGYDTEGFNLICDDLFCNHMDDKCAAYEAGIDSINKTIWDNICFKYNDELYFLVSYDGEAFSNDDESKATYLYFTDLYKADMKGRNRKFVARIPLMIRQKMSFSSIAIEDDTIWIGGIKEMTWTILKDEIPQKEQVDIVSALYSVNLNDYSIYEVLTDVVPSLTIMQMVTSKEAVVFANRYVLSDGKTNQDRVYFFLKDDKRNGIVSEEELVSLLGIHNDNLYYCKDQELIQYNLKNGQSEVIYDKCYMGMACISEGIAIINSDDKYELIGYDGKQRKRMEWDTSYHILAEIGDRFIALKNMSLYWVPKEQVEQMDKNAVLIGPYSGLTYK